MSVSQVEDLRGSPMSVGSLEEIIDEKYDLPQTSKPLVILFVLQSTTLQKEMSIDCLPDAAMPSSPHQLAQSTMSRLCQ